MKSLVWHLFPPKQMKGEESILKRNQRRKHFDTDKKAFVDKMKEKELPLPLLEIKKGAMDEA